MESGREWLPRRLAATSANVGEGGAGGGEKRANNAGRHSFVFLLGSTAPSAKDSDADRTARGPQGTVAAGSGRVAHAELVPSHGACGQQAGLAAAPETQAAEAAPNRRSRLGLTGNARSVRTFRHSGSSPPPRPPGGERTAASPLHRGKAELEGVNPSSPPPGHHSTRPARFLFLWLRRVSVLAPPPAPRILGLG